MRSSATITAPYEAKAQPRTVWILFGLWISLSIHFAVLALVAIFNERGSSLATEQDAIPIELIQTMRADAVKTFQETAKERPKDAKFISDRDLKTEKETSAMLKGSELASLGRQGGASKSEPTENKPRQRRESFALSSEERESLKDPLRTGRASDATRLSPGFMAKLQRGEQLKVNAMGLDYGQYFVRMKEKLAQRWNPHRTSSPAMLQFNEISVLLALVLDSSGELIDLQIIERSQFPAFDQEGVEAIRRAAPFPNPPKSIVQEDGRVYIKWGFRYYISRVGMVGAEID